MTTTELTSTLRELKELRLMAAETASEIETLEDRIKAEMTIPVSPFLVCRSPKFDLPDNSIHFHDLRNYRG